MLFVSICFYQSYRRLVKFARQPSYKAYWGLLEIIVAPKDFFKSFCASLWRSLKQKWWLVQLTSSCVWYSNQGTSSSLKLTALQACITWVFGSRLTGLCWLCWRNFFTNKPPTKSFTTNFLSGPRKNPTAGLCRCRVNHTS